MSDILSAKETLLKAADLLETKGWLQHSFTNLHGCLCTLGALNVAAGLTADACEPNEAEDIFAEFVGGFTATWNDAPDQTAENVIKTMRECAEAQS